MGAKCQDFLVEKRVAQQDESFDACPVNVVAGLCLAVFAA